MSKTKVWMPIYIGDYLADTMHLTAEEHGAYFLLIMHYWREGGAIPFCKKTVKNVCKVSVKKCENILTFFEEKDGKLYHNRIDKEIGLAKENQQKQQDRTKAATEARKAKASTNVNVTTNVTKTPSPSPSPTTEVVIKKDTNVSKKPDENFEEFWKKYPASRRKVKPDALAKWKDAIKRSPPDEIISGLSAYSMTRECLDGYAPYPAKWLKNERWLEDHAADQNNKPKGSNYAKNSQHTPRPANKSDIAAEASARALADWEAHLAAQSV